MTPPLSDLEYHQRIVLYRQKSADGTITMEEMREAVALMRQKRLSAAATAVKGRAKATAKAAPNAAALMNELNSI